MHSSVVAFSDEQARVLINLEQHYSVWVDAERMAASLPYGMTWKTVKGADYLYEVIDRRGNGKSLGRRSGDTEQLYATFQRDKAAAAERQRRSRASLAETCAIYRSLRLPMIAAEGAKILREADRRELLGSHLLVVGTNAMAAYAIEANGFIVGAPGETQDFDLAWSAQDTADGTPLWTVLKAADATYTVNIEKTFQARNASAYEVEVLVAPSRAATMQRLDRPMPIPLPEQEWLLLGRPVDRVVVGRDGSPARIVAPDPRWFALQKLWMSVQEKRNPLKRPKDRKQGLALLSAVNVVMPQYPLDEVFEAEIPSELRPHYDAWRAIEPVNGKNAPGGW